MFQLYNALFLLLSLGVIGHGKSVGEEATL